VYRKQLFGQVCQTVALSVPFTQYTVGQVIPLSATATCTGGSAVYRFEYRPGTASTEPWVVIQDWGVATAQWDTTGLPPGTYPVYVDARNGANPPDNESSASFNVTLVAPGP
jgi:hypothetical protein